MINESQAKKFCKDEISKIENYDKAINDTTQTWEIHHRLELTLDGEFAHSREELKRLGMYYNRPYFELIFFTKSEHRRLHKRGNNNPFYGKHLKGKNSPHYGKHHSEDARQKISEALVNKPKSSFGKKYYEHFGYSRTENIRQYNNEWIYWKAHGKCSWEQ